MQVVGVSAASKTATMAVVGNSKGYYEVDAMDQEELDTVAAADKTTADLIKDINAGTKTLEDLAKAESSIASEIEGKSLVTAFMDLRKIGDVSKTADGKYCYQHSQADQFLLHWSLPPFPNYCSIDTSTACTRYLRLSIPA